jgi:hypothetical protein
MKAIGDNASSLEKGRQIPPTKPRAAPIAIERGTTIAPSSLRNTNHSPYQLLTPMIVNKYGCGRMTEPADWLEQPATAISQKEALQLAAKLLSAISVPLKRVPLAQSLDGQ